MSNNQAKISEKELIERCLSNERKYQEILYRRYADKMYNVALTYAHNMDDASDILQDAFVSMFRNLKNFRFDCPIEAWIRKIVVNTALQKYHREKRKQEVYQDYFNESSANDNFSEDVLERINAKEMIEMVNELPKKAAMVLKLFAIEGYGHNEISDLMNITVGTSKSQLNRARSLLKQSLNELNG